MKIGSVDLAVRPFVIAEIGANHEGDVGVALAMIGEAARAGADAVKFQTYKADTLVAPTETDRFKHFQRLSLPDPVFAELAAAAREAGVLFLSTPFDLAAVDLLDPLVPAFKISSGDLTFHPLLERVARTGKPILLSTGMAAPAEIDAALDVIAQAGGFSGEELREHVVLLHCVSSYPTIPEAANLQRIVALREEFAVPVGYSDHTLGTVACLGAAALGACVIEKHFTLQKEGRTFRDHALSADPADLAQLTEGLRSLALMLGRGGATSTVEDANRVSMRRSLFARVDIKAGSVIQRDQIACLRPGGGLPTSALDAVAGRVALADVPAGHQIPPSAVDLR